MDPTLDRRRLLHLGSAGLALAAAHQLLPVASTTSATPRRALKPQAEPRALPDTIQESTPRRALKKAAGLGMVQGDLTVLQKFELLRGAGFDGVELDRPSRLDLRELCAARDASGLEIHGVVDSVHWQSTLSHADASVREAGRKGLEAALHDAKALGASTVLLVPAVVDKQVGYQQAWERSSAEIAKVVPLAADLKIKIAIENVWNHFLMSPLEHARYVDQFASPWVAAYFDVGNCVNYGWPEQWIEVLGKRIAKIHVKEYSRKKRDQEGLWKGFDVELCAGDCDWPAVVKALDGVPYRGWLTAEVPGGGAQRLHEVAKLMERICAS